MIHHWLPNYFSFMEQVFMRSVYEFLIPDIYVRKKYGNSMENDKSTRAELSVSPRKKIKGNTACCSTIHWVACEGFDRLAKPAYERIERQQEHELFHSSCNKDASACT